MSIIPKDQLRKLIKQYNLKDTKDIQNMLKDMFGDAIQEMVAPSILISNQILEEIIRLIKLFLNDIDFFHTLDRF